MAFIFPYLCIDVGGPEAGDGAAVGIGGEERRAAGVGEGVVEVLHDEHGLAHRLACVEEDGDLIVDGEARSCSLLSARSTSTYS